MQIVYVLADVVSYSHMLFDCSLHSVLICTLCYEGSKILTSLTYLPTN